MKEQAVLSGLGGSSSWTFSQILRTMVNVPKPVLRELVSEQNWCIPGWVDNHGVSVHWFYEPLDAGLESSGHAKLWKEYIYPKIPAIYLSRWFYIQLLFFSFGGYDWDSFHIQRDYKYVQKGFTYPNFVILIVYNFFCNYIGAHKCKNDTWTLKKSKWLVKELFKELYIVFNVVEAKMSQPHPQKHTKLPQPILLEHLTSYNHHCPCC